MPIAPAVTVLMPVYNDAAFLPEAIGSILGQTFGDFEFLIVDDGSTDGTADVLAGLIDPRVRVVRAGTGTTARVGLPAALNRGLDLAAGRYVARMDADDVAEPGRLAAQVAFLDRHPEVGIVGTSRTLIDEAGGFVAAARAVPDDLGIRWKCLLGNPFAHPTVALRKDVLDRHALRYADVPRAEDYDLWPRLLAHCQGVNLPDPLLRYRLRRRPPSDRTTQLAGHDRVALSAIRRLVPDFPVTLTDVTNLRGRFGGYSVRDPGMDPGDPVWVARYLDLLDAFADTYAGDPAAARFRVEQAKSILSACVAAA